MRPAYLGPAPYWWLAADPFDYWADWYPGRECASCQGAVGHLGQPVSSPQAAEVPKDTQDSPRLAGISFPDSLHGADSAV